MKICPICNHQNEDSAKFCDGCGSPLTEQSAQAPAPNAADPAFTEIPSAPASEAPAEKPKKKNFLSKRLFLILGGALSVAGIVVLIGALTNWFGLVSPLQGLFKAFAKTAEAESLTISVKAKMGDEKAKGSFRYVMDPDEETLAFLGGMEEDGRNQKIALYKGDLIRITTSDNMDFDSYNYANIQENALDEDDFFEKLEDLKEEAEDPDWEEYVENAGLEDYIDADEIEAFFEDFYKDKLCDSEWLEEYLGFEKDGNTYAFEPDPDDLAEEMLEVLIDSDVLSRDARDSLKDLRDDIEDVDLDNVKVRIAFTVKRGYISEIEFHLKVKGGETLSIEIEITDPNNTEISSSELKKVKKAAEQIIEQNTCKECGHYGLENHGDCSECGAHGYIGYDGKVCWDCYNKPDYSYAGRGYCCDCGYYRETYYSYYKYRMCESCIEDNYYYSSNKGYCFECGDYEYLYSSGKCYDCY